MISGRVIGLAASLAAGLAVSGVLSAGAWADGAGNWQEMMTGHYRLVLRIGPPEPVFTLAEARARRPRSGEVMVGGQTADMPASMDRDVAAASEEGFRHLELHVDSRATEKPVIEAHVTLTVASADRKSSRAVPIARLYDIEQGLEDLHYGNNVPLPPGDYIVRAAVNGEHVRFHVSVAAGS